MKFKNIFRTSGLICSVATIAPFCSSCGGRATQIYNLVNIQTWLDLVPPPTNADSEANLVSKYMADLANNYLILADEIAYTYWLNAKASLSFYNTYVVKISVKSFDLSRATFSIEENIKMESYTCKRYISFNNVELMCGSAIPTSANPQTPWYLYAKSAFDDQSLSEDKEWSLDFDMEYVDTIEGQEQKNNLSAHISYLNMDGGQPEYVLAKALFANFGIWSSNYFRSVTILE